MGNEGSMSFSGSETKEEESLSTELKDKLHLHDQSCETKYEVSNKQQEVAATDSPGLQGDVDLRADPSNSANEGELAELEQILKQKTYTRSEIDRLTSILHSRSVDLSLEEETAATSNSFGYPHKNGAFQMSVHEDCIELDDDSYPNGAASDSLAEERGKANSLLAETKRRTTEAFTLEKPSNLTEINPSSSAITQGTEIGTSVGSFTAQNSTNLTSQSASSPIMTVLHASSLTSDKEQKFPAPIFNSGDKTSSTQDTNTASNIFGFSFGASAASNAPSSSSPAPSTGFSFGASAASIGFSFGASAAASGPASSSPTPSTGFSFGACPTFGVSTSSPLAPSTGFLFGASAASGATTNSSPATGFAFAVSSTSGATTISSPAPSTFTFGSSSAPSQSPSGSVFGPTTPSVPNPFQFGGQANVSYPQNPSPFQANPQNPFQANPQNPFQANPQNPFQANPRNPFQANPQNPFQASGSMDNSNRRYTIVKHKQRRM